MIPSVRGAVAADATGTLPKVMFVDAAQNHFALFDLPIGFSIDGGVLDERYRALVQSAAADQRSAHLAVTADDHARWLSHIDEAYRILADPLARAAYLFTLLPNAPVGAELEELPPYQRGSSLLERMELRESLIAATNRPDPSAALGKLLTQLAERGAALDKELQGLFADPSTENLGAAVDAVRCLQFVVRCRRDAEDQLSSLTTRGWRSTPD